MNIRKTVNDWLDRFSKSTPESHYEKFGSELDFSTHEAYKLLRTNVEFSFAEGNKCRIIGTTSPCPQEGKSYTSINFCHSLAEDGNKVLLIDLDLRRPTVASKLKMQAEPGMSDLIIGRCGKEDVLRKAPFLHENLDIITSGSIPPNAAELIGSVRMVELLEELSKDYNYIVVDLPPVNSVSDPLIATKFLDGMVVVLKHRYSRRSEISECIRQLEFTKVRILGFVYNGYSRSGGGYSRKYGKYRKYYSSYGYYAPHHESSEQAAQNEKIDQQESSRN